MNYHYSTRHTFQWTTADGRSIFLADMENSHLINCIFYVAARMESYSPKTLNTLINEANYRKLNWSAPTDPRKEEKIQKIRDKVNSKALESFPLSALESILDRLP